MMEDITKIELDKVITLLRENTASSNVAEKNKLADILEKANIIPNMYIATYVRAVCRALDTIKVTQRQDEDGENIEGLSNEVDSLNLDHINYAKTTLEAVKVMFKYALDRQDLICDFDDSRHKRTKIGMCEHENHYDGIDVESLLDEKELEDWERIYEEKGHYEACAHFSKKLNPETQILTIALLLDDENKKYVDTEPSYYCNSCMEQANENIDGYASCDMED